MFTLKYLWVYIIRYLKYKTLQNEDFVLIKICLNVILKFYTFKVCELNKNNF